MIVIKDDNGNVVSKIAVKQAKQFFKLTNSKPTALINWLSHGKKKYKYPCIYHPYKGKFYFEDGLCSKKIEVFQFSSKKTKVVRGDNCSEFTKIYFPTNIYSLDILDALRIPSVFKKFKKDLKVFEEKYYS